MNLTYTLNEFYPGQWYPFHSPTIALVQDDPHSRQGRRIQG